MVRRERQKVSSSILTLLSSHGTLPRAIQTQLFYNVDANDSVEVKRSIRTYIAPQIEAWGRQIPGFREKLRSSLWYFLHKQWWDPARLYSEREPVIDEPEDLMNYYKWAWEELFGGEEHLMPEVTEENYEVVEE